MNKEEIVSNLEKEYSEFNQVLFLLNKTNFEAADVEKWNAGQHLAHLILSVTPLVKVLTLPKFMLSMIFGKANRKSKTYDELIEKYLFKIKNGGKASGKFIPSNIQFENKEIELKKLTVLIKNLNRKIKNLGDNDLDKYILPHPLLGKITLREMFYFTAYHARHHKELVQKQIKN